MTVTHLKLRFWSTQHRNLEAPSNQDVLKDMSLDGPPKRVCRLLYLHAPRLEMVVRYCWVIPFYRKATWGSSKDTRFVFENRMTSTVEQHRIVHKHVHGNFRLGWRRIAAMGVTFGKSPECPD